MFAPRRALNNKIDNSNTHLVRSAVEELKQKKSNGSGSGNNKKALPLGDKNMNNNNNNSNSNSNSNKKTAPTVQTSKRNEFSLYYFFLDNINNQDKTKLEGRIKLLGGNIETFFSKKCTHVITSKHEATANNNNNNNDDDQENIPPSNNIKQKSQAHAKQDVVEMAKKLDINVWGFNQAFDMMGRYIYNTPTKKKQLEKKVLGDVYRNDKQFGPTTNTKNHARRPQFVQFTGHYLIVEDMAKVHRPLVIKEYSKQVLDKNQRHVPWPYLKNTPDDKSPFEKMSKKEPAKNAKKEQYHHHHHDHQTVANQQEEKDKVGDDVASLADTIHPTTTTTTITTTTHKNDNNNNDDNNNNNTNALPPAITTAPCTPRGEMDPQLRASGFLPSMANTQSTLHGVSGLAGSHPRALDVVNSSKRVVENLSKKVSHLPQRQEEEEEEQQKQREAKLELQRKQQQQQQQDKDKEHDRFYCENCHERFSHFKEHLKSESHQAFIRDKNNFKELDLLLESTQRPLRKPDGKKRPSEFAMDMTDIQAPYTKMLKQSSDIHIPVHIEDSQQENWGKYHHVFL